MTKFNLQIAHAHGWILPPMILVVLLFSSFTIISTSEVGIKARFGIIVCNAPLEEGMHIKIPFIDDIEVISLKQHQENFTLDHTQTRDMQPVSVSYKVIYSIPIDKVIANRKEIRGNLFEVLIRPRANESIMDALAQHPAEELIVNRDAISQKVKIKLAERISGHAKIDDISIVEFDFENKDFKDAVQRKVIAKQAAQAAEIKKQQAQAEADQVIITAKAEAESIRIKSNALAGNNKLVDLTIAEKWNGVAPQTVVMSAGNSNILLPIGKNNN
jgi:regulator of protease activity HflC (stomatin/prohibitin superfamily)